MTYPTPNAQENKKGPIDAPASEVFSSYKVSSKVSAMVCIFGIALAYHQTILPISFASGILIPDFGESTIDFPLPLIDHYYQYDSQKSCTEGFSDPLALSPHMSLRAPLRLEREFSPWGPKRAAKLDGKEDVPFTSVYFNSQYAEAGIERISNQPHVRFLYEKGGGVKTDGGEGNVLNTTAFASTAYGGDYNSPKEPLFPLTLSGTDLPPLTSGVRFDGETRLLLHTQGWTRVPNSTFVRSEQVSSASDRSSFAITFWVYPVMSDVNIDHESTGVTRQYILVKELFPDTSIDTASPYPATSSPSYPAPSATKLMFYFETAPFNAYCFAVQYRAPFSTGASSLFSRCTDNGAVKYREWSHITFAADSDFVYVFADGEPILQVPQPDPEGFPSVPPVVIPTHKRDSDYFLHSTWAANREFFLLGGPSTMLSTASKEGFFGGLSDFRVYANISQVPALMRKWKGWLWKCTHPDTYFHKGASVRYLPAAYPSQAELQRVAYPKPFTPRTRLPSPADVRKYGTYRLPHNILSVYRFTPVTTSPADSSKFIPSARHFPNLNPLPENARTTVSRIVADIEIQMDGTFDDGVFWDWAAAGVAAGTPFVPVKSLFEVGLSADENCGAESLSDELIQSDTLFLLTRANLTRRFDPVTGATIGATYAGLTRRVLTHDNFTDYATQFEKATIPTNKADYFMCMHSPAMRRSVPMGQRIIFKSFHLANFGVTPAGTVMPIFTYGAQISPIALPSSSTSSSIIPPTNPYTHQWGQQMFFEGIGLHDHMVIVFSPSPTCQSKWNSIHTTFGTVPTDRGVDPDGRRSRTFFNITSTDISFDPEFDRKDRDHVGYAHYFCVAPTVADALAGRYLTPILFEGGMGASVVTDPDLPLVLVSPRLAFSYRVPDAPLHFPIISSTGRALLTVDRLRNGFIQPKPFNWRPYGYPTTTTPTTSGSSTAEESGGVSPNYYAEDDRRNSTQEAQSLYSGPTILDDFIAPCTSFAEADVKPHLITIRTRHSRDVFVVPRGVSICDALMRHFSDSLLLDDPSFTVDQAAALHNPLIADGHSRAPAPSLIHVSSTIPIINNSYWFPVDGSGGTSDDMDAALTEVNLAHDSAGGSFFSSERRNATYFPSIRRSLSQSMSWRFAANTVPFGGERRSYGGMGRDSVGDVVSRPASSSMVDAPLKSLTRHREPFTVTVTRLPLVHRNAFLMIRSTANPREMICYPTLGQTEYRVPLHLENIFGSRDGCQSTKFDSTLEVSQRRWGSYGMPCDVVGTRALSLTAMPPTAMSPNASSYGLTVVNAVPSQLYRQLQGFAVRAVPHASIDRGALPPDEYDLKRSANFRRPRFIQSLTVIPSSSPLSSASLDKITAPLRTMSPFPSGASDGTSVLTTDEGFAPERVDDDMLYTYFGEGGDAESVSDSPTTSTGLDRRIFYTSSARRLRFDAYAPLLNPASVAVGPFDSLRVDQSYYGVDLFLNGSVAIVEALGDDADEGDDRNQSIGNATLVRMLRHDFAFTASGVRRKSIAAAAVGTEKVMMTTQRDANFDYDYSFNFIDDSSGPAIDARHQQQKATFRLADTLTGLAWFARWQTYAAQNSPSEQQLKQVPPPRLLGPLSSHANAEAAKADPTAPQSGVACHRFAFYVPVAQKVHVKTNCSAKAKFESDLTFEARAKFRNPNPFYGTCFFFIDGRSLYPDIKYGGGAAVYHDDEVNSVSELARSKSNDVALQKEGDAIIFVTAGWHSVFIKIIHTSPYNLTGSGGGVESMFDIAFAGNGLIFNTYLPHPTNVSEAVRLPRRLTVRDLVNAASKTRSPSSSFTVAKRFAHTMAKSTGAFMTPLDTIDSNSAIGLDINTPTYGELSDLHKRYPQQPHIQHDFPLAKAAIVEEMLSLEVAYASELEPSLLSTVTNFAIPDHPPRIVGGFGIPSEASPAPEFCDLLTVRNGIYSGKEETLTTLYYPGKREELNVQTAASKVDSSFWATESAFEWRLVKNNGGGDDAADDNRDGSANVVVDEAGVFISSAAKLYTQVNNTAFFADSSASVYEDDAGSWASYKSFVLHINAQDTSANVSVRIMVTSSPDDVRLWADHSPVSSFNLITPRPSAANSAPTVAKGVARSHGSGISSSVLHGPFSDAPRSGSLFVNTKKYLFEVSLPSGHHTITIRQQCAPPSTSTKNNRLSLNALHLPTVIEDRISASPSSTTAPTDPLSVSPPPAYSYEANGLVKPTDNTVVVTEDSSRAHILAAARAQCADEGRSLCRLDALCTNYGIVREKDIPTADDFYGNLRWLSSGLATFMKSTVEEEFSTLIIDDPRVLTQYRSDFSGHCLPSPDDFFSVESTRGYRRSYASLGVETPVDMDAPLPPEYFGDGSTSFNPSMRVACCGVGPSLTKPPREVLQVAVIGSSSTKHSIGWSAYYNTTEHGRLRPWRQASAESEAAFTQQVAEESAALDALVPVPMPTQMTTVATVRHPISNKLISTLCRVLLTDPDVPPSQNNADELFFEKYPSAELYCAGGFIPSSQNLGPMVPPSAKDGVTEMPFLVPFQKLELHAIIIKDIPHPLMAGAGTVAVGGYLNVSHMARNAMDEYLQSPAMDARLACWVKIPKDPSRLVGTVSAMDEMDRFGLMSSVQLFIRAEGDTDPPLPTVTVTDEPTTTEELTDEPTTTTVETEEPTATVEVTDTPATTVEVTPTSATPTPTPTATLTTAPAAPTIPLTMTRNRCVASADCTIQVVEALVDPTVAYVPPSPWALPPFRFESGDRFKGGAVVLFENSQRGRTSVERWFAPNITRIRQSLFRGAVTEMSRTATPAPSSAASAAPQTPTPTDQQLPPYSAFLSGSSRQGMSLFIPVGPHGAFTVPFELARRFEMMRRVTHLPYEKLNAVADLFTNFTIVYFDAATIAANNVSSDYFYSYSSSSSVQQQQPQPVVSSSSSVVSAAAPISGTVLLSTLQFIPLVAASSSSPLPTITPRTDDLSLLDISTTLATDAVVVRSAFAALGLLGGIEAGDLIAFPELWNDRRAVANETEAINATSSITDCSVLSVTSCDLSFIFKQRQTQNQPRADFDPIAREGTAMRRFANIILADLTGSNGLSRENGVAKPVDKIHCVCVASVGRLYTSSSSSSSSAAGAAANTTANFQQQMLRASVASRASIVRLPFPIIVSNPPTAPPDSGGGGGSVIQQSVAFSVGPQRLKPRDVLTLDGTFAIFNTSTAAASAGTKCDLGSDIKIEFFCAENIANVKNDPFLSNGGCSVSKPIGTLLSATPTTIRISVASVAGNSGAWRVNVTDCRGNVIATPSEAYFTIAPPPIVITAAEGGCAMSSTLCVNGSSITFIGMNFNTENMNLNEVYFIKVTDDESNGGVRGFLEQMEADDDGETDTTLTSTPPPTTTTTTTTVQPSPPPAPLSSPPPALPNGITCPIVQVEPVLIVCNVTFIDDGDGDDGGLFGFKKRRFAAQRASDDDKDGSRRLSSLSSSYEQRRAFYQQKYNHALPIAKSRQQKHTVNKNNKKQTAEDGSRRHSSSSTTRRRILAASTNTFHVAGDDTPTTPAEGGGGGSTYRVIVVSLSMPSALLARPASNNSSSSGGGGGGDAGGDGDSYFDESSFVNFPSTALDTGGFLRIGGADGTPGWQAPPATTTTTTTTEAPLTRPAAVSNGGSSDDHLSAGVIIAIVCGLLLFVVLFVGIVCVRRVRRRTAECYARDSNGGKRNGGGAATNNFVKEEWWGAFTSLRVFGAAPPTDKYEFEENMMTPKGSRPAPPLPHRQCEKEERMNDVAEQLDGM